MSGTHHITMTPQAGISPEQSRDARARAWAYVWQCWQEKQDAAGAGHSDGGDAKERSMDDSSARTIIKDTR